jgi:formylglycine-generating enzyme required for sulfatase activity
LCAVTYGSRIKSKRRSSAKGERRKISNRAKGNPPDFYYSGNNTAANVAWYNGNGSSSSGTSTYGTKAVKQKDPNALDLFDMSGNVMEWCWNFFSFPIPGAPNEKDPKGGSVTDTRDLRGGDWSREAVRCRVSYRNSNYSSACDHRYGIRVVFSSVE